jgi:hypothetical protein
MSDSGNGAAEIARNIGSIASIVGFIGTAIKVGQWKGEHDVRLKKLEDVLKETVEKLSKVDDRVDGIEKELFKTMTSLQKDVEYIKKSVDGLTERRPRAAPVPRSIAAVSRLKLDYEKGYKAGLFKMRAAAADEAEKAAIKQGVDPEKAIKIRSEIMGLDSGTV